MISSLTSLVVRKRGCGKSAREMTDRYTDENISSMIREIFNQGDLDINRLLACVTDNASNMIASVRKIRDVNCVDRVLCVAHT